MSSSFDEWVEGYVFEDKEEVLKKIRLAVRYVLEQAAEKVKLKDTKVEYTGVRAGGHYFAKEVDKDSVISLESEILKDLGL